MAPILDLCIHACGRDQNTLVFAVQSRDVTLLLVGRTTDAKKIFTHFCIFRLDISIIFISFFLPEYRLFKVSPRITAGPTGQCPQSFPIISTIRTEGFSDEMVQAGEPAQHSSTELR